MIYKYKANILNIDQNLYIEFFARNDLEADKRLDELVHEFCNDICVDAKIVSKQEYIFE